MSLYKNNATNTPAEDIGIWPQPHYWWEGGAAWGGMIEYSQFTGDTSHVKTLQQALTANYGPDNDFILSYRKSQTGNDDQAFWALAVMSALEYQFPEPDQAPAAYLDVVTNAFNNIVGRWDETTCDGGLKWQIYQENAYGYNYKNSISNGCAFALGARLARYTGDKKYADWAVKLYDWTQQVGLITDAFEVFDGTDDKTNCAKVADKTQWTYNNAMFLHGSAFMYDYTNGDSVWKDRTSGFLSHAELLFFRPFENSTDVMYEWACETGESGRHCNLDQQSFKAYLSRFMAKTALMAPFTKDTITKYLKASALGAAKSCSGGPDGVTCGSKWYTGGWDGASGVGQQLSALEVTQALLMIKKGTLPVKNNQAQPIPSSSSTPEVSSRPSPTIVPTPAPTPSIQAPSSTATPNSSPVEVESPAKSSEAAPVPEDSSLSSQAVIQSSEVLIPASSSVAASTGSAGGQFGEVKPTTSACNTPGGVCSCTPSVTTTVYVPAVSPTTAPLVPTLSSTLVPFAPPAANSSSPSPSSPLEFQGAAFCVQVTMSSVLGASVVVITALLL
jgi:mannan endo-1,6-alpha-mannosidase